MIQRLWIFRHGETDWNRQERFQGHLDIPLNEEGRAQAKSLTPKLATLGLHGILSSDLSRAVETARIVAASLGVEVWTDARLREAHLGEAQGLTREQIEQRFGEELVTRWRSSHLSDADISYPGGETGTHVLARTTACLCDWLSRETPSLARLGVATHGGVIRRLMQSVLPAGYGPVPIPNTVVYELEFTNGVFRLPEHSPLLKST